MQGLVSKRGQHRQGIIRSKGKRVDVLPSKNKAGQTTPLLTYRMSHSGRELQGQGRSDPGESICGETSETAWNDHLGLSQVFSCLLVTF